MPANRPVNTAVRPAICRDCQGTRTVVSGQRRCLNCGSPRLVAHEELPRLAIAHVDCDAFYATVEKRDRPELIDQPVIVGGGQRGVVAACCYIARSYGIRSAMPMFKALRACPDAVVIRPDMAKYVEVGRAVRRLMLETTPVIEPISIDEAFMDLTGTEAAHQRIPAQSLALLAERVEKELGITISVGLSHNKFLAKVASRLDKPRGFAVIGEAEAPSFLADRSVSIIWGVGKVLEQRLKRDGITLIRHLQAADERDLATRYGSIGHRLYHFSRGQDGRSVAARDVAKSVSSETTFNEDIGDRDALERVLWRLAEAVSRRLKSGAVAGGAVVLKLKTPDFRIRSRRITLPHPTQLADPLWRAGVQLLQAEADGSRFRLIGLGAEMLTDASQADPPDLFDAVQGKVAETERLLDEVQAKFGRDAVAKGRTLLDAEGHFKAQGTTKPPRID